MVKSLFRLWRCSSRDGYYQILGKKDVVRPSNTPLKLSQRVLSPLQRKTILNWRFGSPANYESPINTFTAIAQQLKLNVMTVAKAVKRFENAGYVNPPNKTRNRTGGGRPRVVIKDADTEAQLLSHAVLETMAPMSLQQRILYIKQRYKTDVTARRLRTFYLNNNVTYRVTSTSWRVDEHEKEDLERQRRAYAARLLDIKRRGLPLVYFDESSFHNWSTK